MTLSIEREARSPTIENFCVEISKKVRGRVPLCLPRSVSTRRKACSYISAVLPCAVGPRILIRRLLVL